MQQWLQPARHVSQFDGSRQDLFLMRLPFFLERVAKVPSVGPAVLPGRSCELFRLPADSGLSYVGLLPLS